MSKAEVRIGLLLLVGLIVDRALLTHLGIFGVHPNALLAVALAVAIAGGSQRGAVVGFSAGLLSDVFLTTPLGFCALGYAVAAYLIGSISDGADELLWVSSLLAAAGTVVALVVYMVAGTLGGNIAPTFGDAVRVVFVMAVVDAVVVPLLARRLPFRQIVRREVAW